MLIKTDLIKITDYARTMKHYYVSNTTLHILYKKQIRFISELLNEMIWKR